MYTFDLSQKTEKEFVTKGKTEENGGIYYAQEKEMVYGRFDCVLHLNSCYADKGIVNLILLVGNTNGWKL